MPRYIVHLVNHVGRSIEVEADDPHDAADKVWDTDTYQHMAGLCYQCETHVGALGDWDIASHRDADGIEQLEIELAE